MLRLPPALLLLALLFAPWARAEDAELVQLFAEAGVSGTLLIESLDGGTRHVHDQVRAARRYPAASTFKVPNSLIALEEGVIAGPDSPIAWDGTPYDMAQWNRDQTLTSAFRVSCVWCYQRLARAVGAGAYPGYIRASHYGELREPFVVDQFWLDGSLTISAQEQVAFLRSVVRRQPPFSARSYDALEQVMLADQGDGWRLYAKTGWFTRTRPGLGWYVGYLKGPRGIWLFALNLDTHSAAELPLRQSIALAALRRKGLLPAQPQ